MHSIILMGTLEPRSVALKRLMQTPAREIYQRVFFFVWKKELL